MTEKFINVQELELLAKLAFSELKPGTKYLVTYPDAEIAPSETAFIVRYLKENEINAILCPDTLRFYELKEPFVPEPVAHFLKGTEAAAPVGKLTYHHDGGNEHYHDESGRVFSKEEAYRFLPQTAPPEETCTCAELRKQGDFRACEVCAKKYKPSCLCGGVGCVSCCGPS